MKYPLPNHELFESEQTKENVEHAIITEHKVSGYQLEEAEKEGWLGNNVLLDQYHLVQACYNIETSLQMNIFRCDYWYEDVRGIETVGNYYIPHFFIKHSKCYLDQKEYLNYSDIRIENGVDEIIDLISKLPTEKKNIHIAFLTNECYKTKKIAELFSSFEAKLNKLGYDTEFNRYYDGNGQIVDTDFDFSSFSWDDSIPKTIAVYIDLISDERRVKENSMRFLTLGDIIEGHYIGGKLLYISFLYEIDHFQKISGSSRSLLCHLPEWEQIDLPPYYHFPLYIYYPLSSKVKVDDEDQNIRKLIWRFKGDASKVTQKEHLTALSKVAELVIKTIGCTFGFDLKQKFMLCCVPPSTCDGYSTRYKDFTDQVCKRLNMYNGFDIIKYVKDSNPKHLGGEGKPEYNISNIGFQDKFVIVFDDVYTTGNTMRIFCSKLAKLGANVIGGITLGITKTNKDYENKFGYKGLYDFMCDNIW